MSTFGIYARQILARQVVSEPAARTRQRKIVEDYDKHYETQHRVVQPCPGRCMADACFNASCKSHPETYYLLKGTFT